MNQVIGIETLVLVVDSEVAFEPALAPLICIAEAPGGKTDKFDQIIDSEWSCNSGLSHPTHIS